jgi:hypothetical protein
LLYFYVCSNFSLFFIATKGTWVLHKVYNINNGELHKTGLLLLFFLTPENFTKEAMVSFIHIPPTHLPVEIFRAPEVSQSGQILPMKIL